VTDLVIPLNTIMRVAWDEMNFLADGELINQICLLDVGEKTLGKRVTSTRTGKKGGAEPPLFSSDYAGGMSTLSMA